MQEIRFVLVAITLHFDTKSKYSFEIQLLKKTYFTGPNFLPPPSATNFPPGGYLASSNGRCYRYIEEWLPYYDGERACRRDGAELAGFETEEKWNGLQDILPKRKNPALFKNFSVDL